ncbi:hypothetical protein GCM10009526_18480 [Glutamicibacter creatinolyticus]
MPSAESWFPATTKPLAVRFPAAGDGPDRGDVHTAHTAMPCSPWGQGMTVPLTAVAARLATGPTQNRPGTLGKTTQMR